MRTDIGGGPGSLAGSEAGEGRADRWGRAEPEPLGIALHPEASLLHFSSQRLLFPALQRHPQAGPLVSGSTRRGNTTD